ncbi:MAG TPA: hypothetical protein VKT82_15175 [Ktedonobacterales bacterium]|nr:hypothetical protein [Ktedonobacterales bacterium]
MKYLGTMVYGIAYVLSLLRAPLGLVPYLVKLFLFFVLRIRYEAVRTSYPRELLNLVGDLLNFGLTAVLVWWLVGPPRFQWLSLLLYLPLGAELLRLLAERVPTVFSACWQLLPHRAVAQALQARAQATLFWKEATRVLSRYVTYYALSERERADVVLRILKQRARADQEVSLRLVYLQAFCIVPVQHGLRGGLVRDVARGEVFIHACWTNDPWTLIGMALRRAPWLFDPRFLRRPFYYMSEANRLASLFLLQNAHYCWPAALFQFGHEMRVARLHCFYRVLRFLGADVERKVAADGTFQNDQFIWWLHRRFGQQDAWTAPRSLYSDVQVIAEVLSASQEGHAWSPLEIAERYTYPLPYVNDMLYPRLQAAMQALQPAPEEPIRLGASAPTTTPVSNLSPPIRNNNASA